MSIKEILEKQLQLLSEASEANKEDPAKLCSLSSAISNLLLSGCNILRDTGKL